MTVMIEINSTYAIYKMPRVRKDDIEGQKRLCTNVGCIEDGVDQDAADLSLKILKHEVHIY